MTNLKHQPQQLIGPEEARESFTDYDNNQVRLSTKLRKSVLMANFNADYEGRMVLVKNQILDDLYYKMERDKDDQGIELETAFFNMMFVNLKDSAIRDNLVRIYGDNEIAIDTFIEEFAEQVILTNH
mmetsp:Transcript_23847/g.23522  ORF Transcript_23847/g.23522 Transcript_23847/m.23522 type:complete len:127 (-) Transcript_23847:1139-1519(-)